VILACTVLIQLTSVTDRRTDGQTDGQTDRRPDDGKDARSILLSRVKIGIVKLIGLGLDGLGYITGGLAT